jgi:hypothetical protein
MTFFLRTPHAILANEVLWGGALLHRTENLMDTLLRFLIVAILALAGL